ncbi:uncharacterized protein EI90DRAFT_3020075 [Cantharellus anzutake]|uniref:uncharacterized protein n=1 Tax=Cantharellus anzutake TaxID=1750568 RepID=UPI001905E690|nr:uncharacterized protein EI90DRAFT_3020075 [Cantharellus anzutake]KAF8322409.1 hypothetical protein EI90DRAFT_3020075 [Cantharellus anzutake]
MSYSSLAVIQSNAKMPWHSVPSLNIADISVLHRGQPSLLTYGPSNTSSWPSSSADANPFCLPIEDDMRCPCHLAVRHYLGCSFSYSLFLKHVLHFSSSANVGPQLQLFHSTIFWCLVPWCSHVCNAANSNKVIAIPRVKNIHTLKLWLMPGWNLRSVSLVFIVWVPVADHLSKWTGTRHGDSPKSIPHLPVCIHNQLRGTSWLQM